VDVVGEVALVIVVGNAPHVPDLVEEFLLSSMISASVRRTPCQGNAKRFPGRAAWLPN
jgi:hypothetical protein